MERETVVVALAGELAEVGDGLRRVLVEELDLDHALAGLDRCIGHVCHPTSCGACKDARSCRESRRLARRSSRAFRRNVSSVRSRAGSARWTGPIYRVLQTRTSSKNSPARRPVRRLTCRVRRSSRRFRSDRGPRDRDRASRSRRSPRARRVVGTGTRSRAFPRSRRRRPPVPVSSVPMSPGRSRRRAGPRVRAARRRSGAARGSRSGGYGGEVTMPSHVQGGVVRASPWTTATRRSRRISANARRRASVSSV